MRPASQDELIGQVKTLILIKTIFLNFKFIY